MDLNYRKMYGAYREVIEESSFFIPEEVPANERTAFHGAAAAAHKAGQSHFNFSGKKYPVTMKKDVAKAINSETQKEAADDQKAETEVDGDDESGSKKIECPKCEGDGCAHCDGKGYHMSKVENKKSAVAKSLAKASAPSQKGKDAVTLKKAPFDIPKESVEENAVVDEAKNCGCGKTPCETYGESAKMKENPEMAKMIAKNNADQQAKRDAANPAAAKKRKDAIAKIQAKPNTGSTSPNSIGRGNQPGIGMSTESFEIDEAEKESVDEISRSMTPMNKSFGKTVDSKKFDVYKRHVKRHNVDQATVRMIHDNPDAGESKRMMKDINISKAVGLYKNSMKESSTLPPVKGGKKTVRSADKRPVNVVIGGKTITRMEPVVKRSAAAYESTNENVSLTELKKGDTVMPNKGPHAGKPHTIIHDYGDGHYNIKPDGITGSQIKYRMGAAKAKAADLKLHTEGKVSEVSMDTAKSAFYKRKMQAFDAAHRGDRTLANKLAAKKNKTKAYIAKRESVEEATMDTAAGRKKASAEADAHHKVMVKKWGANHPATKDAANAAKVMKQKESVDVTRENWIDVLNNKNLKEAEDAKTKVSKPTSPHHSDDATRDTYDKQLSTRKGEKDFVDMHNPETPEYADVDRVLPDTFANFTKDVKGPAAGVQWKNNGDNKVVKSG